MGTLDDAIREHLELKRQRGAGDDEIKEAEAEAFGPGDAAEVAGIDDLPEVPGSAITAPAGEGDQLDKVFSPVGEASETAAPVEHEGPESVEEATAESEPAAPAGEAAVETEIVGEAPVLDVEDDAGDALEREREHLLGHPTENYDVDAAIAEEEELDLLSDSRLSDELDRALGGPEEIPPVPDEPVESAVEPEAVEVEPEEPLEPVSEVTDEEVEVFEDETVESDLEPVSEDPISEEAEASDSGEIPLDDTPDFLEDSPDGEDLWFEQKEPKDFDFGD